MSLIDYLYLIFYKVYIYKKYLLTLYYSAYYKNFINNYDINIILRYLLYKLLYI